MGKPRVEVDQNMCIGSGNCVELAPGAFQLDDEGLAEVVDPSAEDMETLQEAAKQCPVFAITVEEDSDEE